MRWPTAGLGDVRMLLQVHDELVFEVPEGKEEAAAAVVREVMAHAAEPALKLDVPLDVEVGWGAELGRRALSEAAATEHGPVGRPGRAGAGRADQLLRLHPAPAGAPAVPVHRRPHLRRGSSSAASPMRC